MTFYATVGQKYRNDEKHPCGWHPDGYVRIEAADMTEARSKVVSRAGIQWAFVYPADKFDFSYYPLGELAAL